MNEPRLLSAKDNGAISEILAVANETLAHTAERHAKQDTSIHGQWLKTILSEGTTTNEGICDTTSDAVTYSAQRLGFYATTQFANNRMSGGHFFTSFAHPSRKPSERDLIACLTWGQFANPRFRGTTLPPYVGRRRGIEPLLAKPNYDLHYYSAAVNAVASTYRKSNHLTGREWLLMTPAQHTTRAVPQGEHDGRTPEVGIWGTELTVLRLFRSTQLALTQMERAAQNTQSAKQ